MSGGPLGRRLTTPMTFEFGEKYRLDPGALSVVSTWEDYRRVDSAADDVLTVTENVRPGYAETAAIFIERSGKPWWLDVFHRRFGWWPGTSTLLNNQVLAGVGNGVKLMTVAGEQAFADHQFERNEMLNSKASVAAGGERFAVAATVVKQPFLSDFPVEKGPRLLVYDVGSRSRILEMRLDAPLGWGGLWGTQRVC
jgi:hypothetical protein